MAVQEPEPEAPTEPLDDLLPCFTTVHPAAAAMNPAASATVTAASDGDGPTCG